MKVWAIDYNQDDSPSGWVFEWFPNKVSALVRVKALTADGSLKASNIEGPQIIDVPTKKAELIRFLNTYASSGITPHGN